MTEASATRQASDNTAIRPFQVNIPEAELIPVAVSVFPDDIYAAPRSWVEKAYPNLIHFNRADKGGHFAAWEQPEFFNEEVRTAFRSLR